MARRNRHDQSRGIMNDALNAPNDLGPLIKPLIKVFPTSSIVDTTARKVAATVSLAAHHLEPCAP